MLRVEIYVCWKVSNYHHRSEGKILVEKNLIEKIVDRDQGRGEKQAASSRDNSLLSCFYF